MTKKILFKKRLKAEEQESMGWQRMRVSLKVLVAQLCLTLCDPMDCSLPGSSVHGILQAKILECHALLQRIFPIQGLNPRLLHCRWILYHLASGRYHGGGNVNPLQYSYLENSMDRGAWQAIVHGVTKSQTQLNTHTLLRRNPLQGSVFRTL